MHSPSICHVGLVAATLTPQVLSPFTQLQNELILIDQLFSSNLNPDLTGYIIKRNLCSSELPLGCLIGYLSALSKAPQKWLGYSICAYFAESVENWRRWWCLWGWRWCNKHRGNDPSQCDTCSIGPRGDNSSIVVTRDTIHYCLVYTECARQSKIVIMLFIGVFFIKHCLRHDGPMALSTLAHSIPLILSRSFNKKSGSNFSLVLFGNGWEIPRTTLTHPLATLLNP